MKMKQYIMSFPLFIQFLPLFLSFFFPPLFSFFFLSWRRTPRKTASPRYHIDVEYTVGLDLLFIGFTVHLIRFTHPQRELPQVEHEVADSILFGQLV